MADAQAKRALEVDLLEEDRKKSKHGKKEERKKEKKERKAEKKAKKGEEGRGSRALEGTDRKHTSKTTNGYQGDDLPPKKRNNQDLQRSPFIHFAQHWIHASQQRRPTTAESDINTLFKDTDVLFSGMKQMQKQQNYLMQRDNNQARKEANMQAVISNWPAQAQEQDRDRIIDWLVGNAQIPAREFQYASHKVQIKNLTTTLPQHMGNPQVFGFSQEGRIRKKPIALLANR